MVNGVPSTVKKSLLGLHLMGYSNVLISQPIEAGYFRLPKILLILYALEKH